MERVISFFFFEKGKRRRWCRVQSCNALYAILLKHGPGAPSTHHKSKCRPTPESSPLIVWEPGLAPALQNFNRNHEKGSFFKGFINCDQPPSAVTHVIQAAVMTPSKGCPRGGRRQGGGYKGNRASEVSHLPLNRSREPSAGGGQGQL